MKILCVIPARGGSKGLKNKNVMALCGKPIIGYTIEAAIGAKLVDKIVVSTDDQKIAAVSSKYGVGVIDRPKKYASDKAAIEGALRHAVEYVRKEGYSPDIVVWLQANMPVRKKGQVDEVIKKLIKERADSSVTVYKVDQYPQWMKTIDKKGNLKPLFPKVRAYRRQEVEPMYLLDGAIVAIKTDVLMGSVGRVGVHVFMGEKMLGVIQEKKYATELHDKDDLDKAKEYLRKKSGK